MSATINTDLIRRTNPTEEYELVQRVGGGTYGEVYKAKHLRTGEFAAIKVVKVEPGDNFTMIQQEILMMRDCRHPNIVAYYNSYLRRDRLWIAMEYCGGGSLQDIYHMTGPLGELQIAFVCRETLKGLQYLHGLGKIHRDVKGANILLTTDGEVKLADFGVAAQITATIGKRKSFIGTPYWMAPEVAAVERKGGYNHMCDVWAVGITAIELAELQPPWFDLHPMRVLYLMTKSNYKPPQLRDRVKWSPHFHDFVKQCLVKNPKKRPTPEKLQNHHFLQGNYLTTRQTRDLLDRVNNPSRGIYDDPETLGNSEDDLDLPGPSNGPRVIPSAVLLSEENRQLRPLVAKGPEENGNFSKNWGIRDSVSDEKGLLDCVDLELSARGLNVVASNKGLKQRNEKLKPKGSFSDKNTMPAMHGSASTSNSDNEATLKRESNKNDDSTLKNDLGPVQNGSLGSHRPPRVGTPEGSSDSESYVPPAAPPRRPKSTKLRRPMSEGCLESENRIDRPSPSDKKISFGLPPTPKVTMGACLSTVFHGCPLRINCTASWVHPETKDQHVLLGTEEGIYSLNLNQLHEATMDRIHPRRCSWMYVVQDVLMAVQGRTPHLYRHDLVPLLQRDLTNKISLPMNKMPEKFTSLVPRKLVITTRMAETKGCLRCCVQRNPYSGMRYLCAAVPSGIILMQWYEPWQKFLIIKQVDCGIPLPLNAFELLVSPENEYPVVCTGVRKGPDRKQLVFDLVNLNSNASWFSTAERNGNFDRLDVTAMRQLEKDVVVVCYESKVQVTNLQGKLKSSRLASAELRFGFRIESVVCLSDSVLAFHRHGMQGRSFLDNQVTQDINDKSHAYRVLGSDKVVVLESKLISTVDGSDTTDSNLCILTGHESTL